MEQKRKSLLVLSLVLVLGLSGSAFAYNDVYWDGSESSTWTDGNNWDTGSVPGLDDYALIGDPTVTQPVIVSGQAVTAGRVVVGMTEHGSTLDVMTGGSITSDTVNFTVGRGGGGGTLNISGGDVIANAGFLMGNFQTTTTGVVNMTGGTLTVHSGSTDPKKWYLRMLTIGDGGLSTFNMDGGAVTVDEDMWFAYHRSGGNPGYLNMTDGTIDVGGTIMLSKSASVSSAIQLDGGVITASDLVMTANGSMDLTDGRMILDGDDTVAVWGYVDAGLITGYGIADNVLVGYDSRNDKTIVVAIPEPATMVLLGLGGLLSLRRRRTN